MSIEATSEARPLEGEITDIPTVFRTLINPEAVSGIVIKFDCFSRHVGSSPRPERAPKDRHSVSANGHPCPAPTKRLKNGIKDPYNGLIKVPVPRQVANPRDTYCRFFHVSLYEEYRCR
jgi:hypothetical protein